MTAAAISALVFEAEDDRKAISAAMMLTAAETDAAMALMVGAST